MINEEEFTNEKLSYFKSKTHLCDPFGILVYRNSSECCLGEAGECCYDENKKGRLKELKMTHGT